MKQAEQSGWMHLIEKTPRKNRRQLCLYLKKVRLGSHTSQESTNAHTAHLLGDHDGERCKGCAADTRDSKHLNNSLGVVGCADDLVLDEKLSVNVVKITCGLDWMVAQAEKRPE